jgi:pimeloyl-ACP methyl ester carboxylesterase
MEVRSYGGAGPIVIALHGGPGAPGSVGGLAAQLADSFRVLEPFQRSSGAGPLTVARHIADLHELIKSRCNGEASTLIGHSWGAMLALAYAAAHPATSGPLVLIGCGTFDTRARERMRAIVEERMDSETRMRIEQLPDQFWDFDERLAERGRLIAALYSCNLISEEAGGEVTGMTDMRAQEETWNDMIRLQEEEVYPAAFAAIKAPVIMLHGAEDPHPGRMIHRGLQVYLPQIEYREWERCGHYPWLEREVRDEFFQVMRDWLGRKLRS